MKDGPKATGLREMREARIQGRKAAHRAERAKAACGRHRTEISTSTQARAKAEGLIRPTRKEI